MSEEEIIEILKRDMFMFSCEQEEAIQGLLDLYNKQKEKNKELTDEYMIQKHLINPDFLKNYISKDKIKNIIESSSYPDFAIQKIIELLEEK